MWTARCIWENMRKRYGWPMYSGCWKSSMTKRLPQSARWLGIILWEIWSCSGCSSILPLLYCRRGRCSTPATGCWSAEPWCLRRWRWSRRPWTPTHGRWSGLRIRWWRLSRTACIWSRRDIFCSTSLRSRKIRKGFCRNFRYAAWNLSMCLLDIKRGTGFSGTFTLRSRAVRAWRWRGTTAPGKARWWNCWCGSTTQARVGFWWTALISGNIR